MSESVASVAIHSCLVIKKEVNYNKAVKNFGRDLSDGALADEFLGLLNKKVWRLVMKKELTRSQRAILPSNALFRMKEKEKKSLLLKLVLLDLVIDKI